MKQLAYAVLAVVAIAVAPALARGDTCSDLKQYPLPPLTFVAFDRTNPATGLPYGPSDQITIDGTTMLANAAFDALDDVERTLTWYGYTLRDIEDKTLSELGTCVALMTGQVEIVKKILADSSGPLNPSTIAEKIQKAIDLARSAIPNWGELYDKIKDHSRDVYLPPVPTYSAPVPHPKRTELKPLVKARSWAWEIGEKNSLWVQLLASLAINGSKTAAKAEARGQMNGSVLGLWEGEVLGASAIASVTGEDDKLAELSVKVSALGKTLFTRSWSEKVLKVNDDKVFDVHHELSIRFAIGPIPCKGTVGFMGAAGVKYGYEVIPIQLMAFAVPYADTKLFAQLGVDIVIAGAGVGGEVTLINDHVTLQGSLSVTFEDQPSLVLELSGKNSVDCLSGNLYAFVRINFLFIRKTFKHVFFKWTGFKKDSDLFNFRTTWGPDGVKAEGDLTAEDVMEVTADNEERRLVDLENASQQRVFEVFDAIARDLNSADSAQVTAQRLRHQSIAQSIDDAIAQYRAELTRATGGG
jgi:hypothetical protein